jgi:hypothetical protein
MTRYVHPGSFKYLNATPNLFVDHPSFAGGIWGYVKGSPYTKLILEPWVRCAKTPACIAPPGSSLGNHRYDQAVVSVIT